MSHEAVKRIHQTPYVDFSEPEEEREDVAFNLSDALNGSKTGEGSNLSEALTSQNALITYLAIAALITLIAGGLVGIQLGVNGGLSGVWQTVNTGLHSACQAIGAGCKSAFQGISNLANTQISVLTGVKYIILPVVGGTLIIGLVIGYVFLRCFPQQESIENKTSYHFVQESEPAELEDDEKHDAKPKPRGQPEGARKPPPKINTDADGGVHIYCQPSGRLTKDDLDGDRYYVNDLGESVPLSRWNTNSTVDKDEKGESSDDEVILDFSDSDDGSSSSDSDSD